MTPPSWPPVRLGPYELGSALGAGGMGEVYRARDTRLGRDVAIKILPADFGDDPDRLRRFEREARAAAALSHPNLLALYDIGTDQGTCYLVTELLDGSTLRARLGRPVPLEEAVPWAAQIADGLAAAHARGIIHRDLKPENVFVTSTGAIKILDFGIAKATDTAPLGPSDASSATHLAPVHTEAGVVLGTPGYMAPEQVRGQPVDTRADIFAFGCLLFEMSTGRRAFDGTTTMDVLSAILNEQPALQTPLPPGLTAIIQRCLAKAPGERFQSAADLAFALRHTAVVPVTTGQTGRQTDRAVLNRWRWLAIAASVVAIGAFATLAVSQWRRLASTAPSSSSAVTMTALTSTGDAALAQLSPDGKFVAYVRTEGERTSVWVRQLGSGSAVQILPESEETVWGVTITPDSNFVDVARSRSVQSQQPMDLWRVPFLGGPQRKVAEDVASLPGWSSDGRQMAYLKASPREDRLMVAQPDGSAERTIAARTSPRRFTSLRFSSRPDTRPVWFPDGRTIAVLGMDEERGQGVYQVLSIDAATGVEAELRSTGFTPRGGMVLSQDGQSFTINAGRGGTPQLVTVRLGDGAETRLTNDLAAYVGVSAAGGSIVTTRRQTLTELLVMDAAGRNERRVGRELPAAINGLSWLGGSRLLFGATLAGGSGIWSTDLSGTTDLFVTPGAYPSVSADGRTVAFFRGDIWRSDGDGRNVVRIATGAAHEVSSDGARVFYISGVSGAQAVWVVDASGEARQLTSMAVLTVSAPTLSPDGRLMAFFAADGRAVITSVDGGEPVRQLPIRPGRLRWTPDGSGLAYVDSAGTAGTNVWVQPIDGAAPYQLTRFDDGKGIASFTWSPDGKQLAVARAVTTSDIVLLKGVQ